MVKKSFLGRFFGKKKEESKQTKPKEEAKAAGQTVSTATATLPLKKESPPLTQRIQHPQANAEERKVQRGPSTDKQPPTRVQQSPERSSDPRAQSGGNGKQPVKDKKTGAPILEPEILSRTAKMASESRDQIDVIARKMTTQEEVSIKISDGIKGLSNVLNNIDQRLEEQSQQSFEIARTVKTIPEMIEDLPESSRAGVELLHSISKILENQSAATKDLGKQISGLPEALSSLKEQIDKDVDERARDRNMVQETVESMKSSLDHLEERNTKLGKQQEESTSILVESLKKSQMEHQRQIDALMEKNLSTNRLLLYLLYVVVIGLIIIVSII
ncbi:MAG: hypothetical protein ABIK28_16700 [Planctomycetota bacterium]